MSKSDSKKKKAPNKRLLVLSISLSAVIIFGFVTYRMLFQNQEPKFSMKAAIVDQLYEHFPNSAFIATATDLLTNAGFSVSYFSSESVNVPFYKELVEGNYGIIILRSHSAMRMNEPIVDLFTSEEYDGNKYYDYRRDGLLSKAEYLVPLGQSTGKFYFAITPNFVEHFGNFPHSIIIAMGCSGMNVSSMAQAFIGRSAIAYVGWTNIVLPEDTDYETTKFLNMFLGENRTLATSIAVTNSHTYHDPDKNITVVSRMDFYPMLSSIGDLRISDLIAEAKDQKTLSSTVEQFSFLNTKVIANERGRIEGIIRFVSLG
jgi:hypothetical protein